MEGKELGDLLKREKQFNAAKSYNLSPTKSTKTPEVKCAFHLIHVCLTERTEGQEKQFAGP